MLLIGPKKIPELIWRPKFRLVFVLFVMYKKRLYQTLTQNENLGTTLSNQLLSLKIISIK